MCFKAVILSENFSRAMKFFHACVWKLFSWHNKFIFPGKFSITLEEIKVYQTIQNINVCFKAVFHEGINSKFWKNSLNFFKLFQKKWDFTRLSKILMFFWKLFFMDNFFLYRLEWFLELLKTFPDQMKHFHSIWDINMCLKAFF